MDQKWIYEKIWMQKKQKKGNYNKNMSLIELFFLLFLQNLKSYRKFDFESIKLK